MATKVRQVVSVPHPATKILDVKDIHAADGLPDCPRLLEHFKSEGRLTPEAIISILQAGTEILKKEPNVLDLPAPITIVGDIHGQFFDLVKLLQVGGDPATTRYLFLGDYVDRGYFSLECVIYLWSLKIRYPQTISLLRGNHECRHLTEYFTFKTEVEYKSSEEVYDVCMDSFDCLPLAAIMQKQFFCVHGGLSPEVSTVADIQKINRFMEPDESGIMCDLLWADPHEDFDVETGSVQFLHNETRGCSYVYTHKAACEFLDRNNLLSVIRAHEAQDQGYRMYKPNPKTGFPSVITIFSAPNYLDVYGNKAAVMIYSDNSMNIKKFSNSSHPYWLPNFMDVFTWSLPFIGEKTTEMLHSVLDVCNADELSDVKDNTDLEVLAEKMKETITHIKAQKDSFSDQAKASEQALLLHGLASPTGETQSAKFEDLHTAMQSFEGIKKLDKNNEKKPTTENAMAARQYRRRQTLEDIHNPMV
eukprot:m.1637434 g.1637434  ORF g.1637434 m.1637434 type:complete len:475 (+) comp25818_c0_seq1:222-1646(+)